MSSSDWSSDESQAGLESEDESGGTASNSEDEGTTNGEALQLIKISQQPAGSPKLELNQSNLDELLKSTEDRPLCVISVVGPPRLGKSLLLNYIKLQLEAMEEGQRNFDLANVTQSLTGFEWNSGMDAVTKGIWAWSRAFLIDTSEKDIAVLLLDTQGIDDEISTPHEINSILGLSFLSSSIIIYNVANDISSSTFKTLLPIFKFGIACKQIDEECSEEPPFQKISFLIRDWSNPSQYNYGSQDGKLLLKNKIKTFRGDVKTQSINVFRKHKCFGQYEAFLLPNVGQTALESTFTGCLPGLDSEFKTNLQSYINSLLKEENLFVKQIIGVDVTQTDYANYMRQFVNMFNTSSGLVTGETLFKTRCEILHNNIVEKSMKKYQDVINRKQGTCIYLNKIDLQTLHENAEKQAKALFQRAKKLEDFTKEYEKRLHNELKNAYEVVQSVNDSSRKSHITECIGIAENGYRNTIADQLVFKENEITIYDDGLIQHISDNAMHTAVQDFIIKFPDEDQESLKNLKGTLEQVLLSILQPFLAANNDNANKANSILVQKCSKIYQDYDARMKRMIQDFPFVDAPVLSQAHLMNYGVAMETFDNFEKPGDEHMIHQHRKHVETELDKLYKKFVDDQKLKIENRMREGSSILEKQATAYTEALRVKAQDISSAEELELVHNQAVINVTNKFKEFNPFPETASQHGQLNTRLRDQLRLAFDLVKREELDTKRKHEERLKKESLRCIEMYKQEMDALRANAEFFEEETLLEAHETCFNNAISSYDDVTANDISDFVDVYRTQLQTTMEARYSKMKIENDRTVELVKSKARNWISTCQKEYQEAMREPIETCEQQEEFKQEHEKMKFQAVKSFNSKWSYNSNGFRGEFIKELKEEIGATFMELLDMFELRRNSDNDKTTAVKEEARKYYHEEMATHLRNHQFIQPNILKNLHEQASQSAITRCAARIPLKESQKSLLKQALERSFKKYNDENTMTLNWDLGSEPAIGIDLGTTYCCVAVFYQGRTIIIRNAEGRHTTPSYVAFSPDGKYSIGQPAKDNAYRNAENTVYDAKRIIGRSMQDQQLQNDMNFWPFLVVNGENGPAIEIYGKEYPPEQISALLLKQLVAQAEKILGVVIRKAVITVPAYFADGQRAATIDAGEMAGLDVLQILDEPTAAALAYKLERFKEDARKVLIFDLGGGTFDISILEMDGGNIKILNKDGDTHLGGEDFDKAMMQYCADEFKRETGIDPFQGKNSTQKQEKDAAKQRLRRLQTYCERAKIELATTIAAVISVDAFFEGTHLKVEVTRQKFEELNAAHFQKTIQIVERSLRQIGLSKAQIDDVVLVGGSTRIPKMQKMLTEFFDGKALNHKVNPDEAVAYGAAVQAALLNGGQAKGSLDIGVVEDVTPMSLGVEAIVDGVRGAFSAIIPKNTKIPTIHKDAYRTFRDNQENAMIRIYQGESPIAQDNTLLGEFVLNGIPPAPAGKECVDVTMEIDAMGVLNVKAMVKSTRGQQSLKVGEKRTGRMSQGTKQKLLLEVQAA